MEEGYVDHTEGVAWNEAPLPKPRHRCWAQSEGLVEGEMIWRCPCGAIMHPDRGQKRWADRNSRGPGATAQTSFMGDLLLKYTKRGKKK